MSEKYKVKNPDGIYFITFTVIDWVDLFTRPIYKHILVDSLIHCQDKKGLIIYAYVFMSNHLHLIVKAQNGNLQDIVRDYKRFTNLELIKAIRENTESRKVWLLRKFEYEAKQINRNNKYKIWQDGFHPVELDNNKKKEQRLNYIHNNSVVEELVEKPEDYIYSSARNYCWGSGVIDIERLI